MANANTVLHQNAAVLRRRQDHEEDHAAERDLPKRVASKRMLLEVPHDDPHPGGRDQLDEREPPVEQQQLDPAEQQHERARGPGHRREVAPGGAELVRRRLDLGRVGIRDGARELHQPGQRLPCAAPVTRPMSGVGVQVPPEVCRPGAERARNAPHYPGAMGTDASGERLALTADAALGDRAGDVRAWLERSRRRDGGAARGARRDRHREPAGSRARTLRAPAPRRDGAAGPRRPS